ncbi:hypothetical protein EB796_021045 [Bugula neritina]|uniref:Protein MIX23 n=1 Tax=Bugula neritina TaxID=10212 RepID=A0A7J7J456_BUGNE|nr:hypothetical protein EB796_021045 [Bugula neritina]
MSASINPEKENQNVELCSDYMKFQDLLDRQRKNDDIIINLINSTIPSIESFRKETNIQEKCKEIKENLDKSHKAREEAIKKCISYHAENTERLRKAKDVSDSSNERQARKAFSNAQIKLRSLQSELGVEEIVQERTRKVLHERCRAFF